MLGGKLLLDPLSEEGGEGVHFVLREPHGVTFCIIQDSETFANGTRGGDVTGSLREAEAEMIRQSQDRIEIDFGQALR